MPVRNFSSFACRVFKALLLGSLALSLHCPAFAGVHRSAKPSVRHAAIQNTLEPNLVQPAGEVTAWKLEQNGTGKASIARDDDSLKVSVSAIDGTVWHTQVFQVVSPLQEGVTYTVEFQAKADHPRRITLLGTVYGDDYHNIGLKPESLVLSTEWSQFRRTFVAERSATIANRVPYFLVGADTGDIWVRAVSVRKGPALPLGLDGRSAGVRAAGASSPIQTQAKALSTLGSHASGSSTYSEAVPPPDAGPQRVTKVTWTIDTRKVYGDGQQSFLFPLPMNGFGQSVTYEVSGARKVEPVTDVTNNNLIRIYPQSANVTVHVTCKAHYPKAADILRKYNPSDDGKYTDDAQSFLKVTYGLDQNTPQIGALASTLKGENNLATVKNVLRYVSKQVKYDYKYWRTTDEILDHKVAQCEGQSAIAVALLRRLHIPARMIFMVYPNKPKGNVVDGHTVVQFYLAGSGWLIGDAGQNDTIRASVSMNMGEEPIPYYYCRKGMGALVQENETLTTNYPEMWQYLQDPGNKQEMVVASAMFDYFKVMYDCTVEQNALE